MKTTKPQTTCPEGIIQAEMNNLCKKLNIQFTKEIYTTYHKDFEAYIYFKLKTKQVANAIIEKLNNHKQQN